MVGEMFWMITGEANSEAWTRQQKLVPAPDITPSWANKDIIPWASSEACSCHWTLVAIPEWKSLVNSRHYGVMLIVGCLVALDRLNFDWIFIICPVPMEGPQSHNHKEEEQLKQDEVEYVRYTSEEQLVGIMSLIEKDLSEPYSIYTYRYFINNWPQLCWMVLWSPVI